MQRGKNKKNKKLHHFICALSILISLDVHTRQLIAYHLHTSHSLQDRKHNY